MRTALSFAVVILANAAGEIAITHAMKQVGEVVNFTPLALLRVLRSAIRIRWMWVGIFLMTLQLFFMLMLLSWENVSFVIPATALSYVVGALGAKFLLGEKVSGVRWIGVSLVSIGVALVWIG